MCLLFYQEINNWQRSVIPEYWCQCICVFKNKPTVLIQTVGLFGVMIHQESCRWFIIFV
ncbi:hypothetical protein VRK_41460 [Vibrio sp. MEBiC08052]|nr:hypothetical protein VRK_41460 [Vibrio sp. MEBiC08052]